MKKTAILVLILLASPAWAGKRREYNGACLPRDVGHYQTLCDVTTNQTFCAVNRLADQYLNDPANYTLGACQPRITECSPVPALSCCQYGTAGVQQVVGDCTNCQFSLGGVSITGCICDAYADGYGTSCIPVGQ